MYVYLQHDHTWYPRGQKREPDALELELQLVVSCLMCAGTKSKLGSQVKSLTEKEQW